MGDSTTVGSERRMAVVLLVDPPPSADVLRAALAALAVDVDQADKDAMLALVEARPVDAVIAFASAEEPAGGLERIRQVTSVRMLVHTEAVDEQVIAALVRKGVVDVCLEPRPSPLVLLAAIRHATRLRDMARRSRDQGRRLERMTTRLREVERHGVQRDRQYEETRQALVASRSDLARSERQATITHLVRGLAHELNNPLAVIMGHAQRLPYKLDDPLQVQRRVDLICHEVDACIDLVERLRRFAAPLDESMLPCRPVELLEATRERLPVAVAERLTWWVDEPLPAVQAGPRNLVQVFVQVLTNACEAGAARVDLTHERHGQRIHLYFDDDGRVPDRQVIERATKPFFTTHETGHDGIGLSLAHALVRDMGGSVGLNVRPDGARGTRCTVILPVAEMTEEIANESAAPSGGRSVALVVDDEPLVAELLHDLLTDNGWSCVAVGSCGAARQAVNTGSVGLVLCDLNLPDGSGAELLRWMHRTHPHLAGHLVVVSGDPEVDEVDALVEDLDCRVLGKPFRQAQVLELIGAMR